MATQDSDRQMEKVVDSISVSEENFRKIVGGAWETILGRSIDEVGDVSTEHVQDSNDAEFYGYLVREQNQREYASSNGKRLIHKKVLSLCSRTKA